MRVGRKVILGLLAALVVIYFLATFLIRQFSPSFFEELLEGQLNCDAAIGGVDARIAWFREGRFALSEVRLWEKGKTGEVPAIQVARAELAVDFWPLLRRELCAKRLWVEGPKVRISIDEDGEVSLDRLFENPREQPQDQARDGGSEGQEADDEESLASEESKGVTAQKSVWLASLEETRLADGKIQVVLEDEGITIEVVDFGFEIEELRFDPERLETLNEIVLDLRGEVGVFDKAEVQLVRLGLAGPVRGKLFDETSGEMALDVSGDLQLAEHSFVSPKVKIVRRVWELVKQVDRFGIQLGELPLDLRFGRSESLVAHYHEGVVTLREPLSLGAGPWELGLSRNSWLETVSGEHEIGIEFLLSETTSSALGGWLGRLSKEASELVLARFVDENQVLWVVQSSGDLKDPQLSFFSQLPEAKGVVDQLEDAFEGEFEDLRDKAKEEVKGFLEDLFGD